jgi:hypothetical protein
MSTPSNRKEPSVNWTPEAKSFFSLGSEEQVGDDSMRVQQEGIEVPSQETAQEGNNAWHEVTLANESPRMMDTEAMDRKTSAPARAHTPAHGQAMEGWTPGPVCDCMRVHVRPHAGKRVRTLKPLRGIGRC